ncbi:YggT family protein [Pseudoduganella sp. SL102]|uniref:YggT family protein n=2 Tax=Pseudoduganella albidiflava TaxID=321983 RepID=A0ABX5RMF8_9BURK|nr:MULTISPECIES: YggT family protein [Pseudoduganella]QBH99776.1 YggT family protein [Pseudoduganella albidiflava]WBS02230.1 YggT family protein [Pseudoduganella sp. SL102]
MLVLSIVMLIVDTVAVLLGGVLLLRFWMQATRVRPPSSVAQFTFQLSDWLVRPMRRLVPGVGGYDWASLLGAFLIVVLATSVRWFAGYPFDLIMLMALHRFLQWILYGFMILLVVEAIFSWVNPHAPLAPFVRALNEPILKPVRRVVPLVGNLDLSLLVALVLLQIAQLVLDMLFR